MSDEDDAQKTEAPTQKRLDEARKRGQVPVSRELNNWLLLTGGTILIATLAPSFMAGVRDYLRNFLEKDNQAPSTTGDLKALFGDASMHIFGQMMLPFIVLMAIAFLSPFLQAGPIFAPEAVKPDLSKLSQVKGWERIFSRRSLFEFVKGVFKLCIVGLVGYMAMKPYYSQLEHMIGMPVPPLLDEVASLFVRLMTAILVVLMVLAVIDVTYQRTSFMNKMRMSKQELKDEFRQSEGDPLVKGKLRQIRQERARKRMMQNVPKADVVITNPTHFAVALQYDPKKMNAPLCLAKGHDDLALRIRAVAEEHKIVIVENPPLARILYDTVEVDQAIPAEHYKAVAEVISYVFRLRGRLPGR